jgi:hypothetical protein
MLHLAATAALRRNFVDIFTSIFVAKGRDVEANQIKPVSAEQGQFISCHEINLGNDGEIDLRSGA